MRNTPPASRGAWATFSKSAREGAGLSQSELARRLQIDRSTLHRWETAKARPENADMVQSFARETGVELDEALAAAGLRPGVPPPAEPTRERDEEIDLIMSAPVDDATRRRMLERLAYLRERDRKQRLEDIRFLLERGA
jgi:transcriptional regulator with XRE-family HTH domain